MATKERIGTSQTDDDSFDKFANLDINDTSERSNVSRTAETKSRAKMPMQRRENWPAMGQEQKANGRTGDYSRQRPKQFSTSSPNSRPANGKSVRIDRDRDSPCVKLNAEDEHPCRLAEWRNENPLPPMKVKDLPCVWAINPEYPAQEDLSYGAFKDASKPRAGKWLLFTDVANKDQYGYTGHDYVWFKIKEMTENGVFFRSKTGTGVESDTATSLAVGVIVIYTLDYTDVQDVVDKASEIASNFVLLKPFFYKTNEASAKGQYRVAGSRNISIYQCNVDGQVDKRGQGGKWKPINDL